MTSFIGIGGRKCATRAIRTWKRTSKPHVRVRLCCTTGRIKRGGRVLAQRCTRSVSGSQHAAVPSASANPGPGHLPRSLCPILVSGRGCLAHCYFGLRVLPGRHFRERHLVPWHELRPISVSTLLLLTQAPASTRLTPRTQSGKPPLRSAASAYVVQRSRGRDRVWGFVPPAGHRAPRAAAGERDDHHAQWVGLRGLYAV